MNGYLVVYEVLTGKIYQSMLSDNNEEDKKHFKTVNEYWSSVDTTVLYVEALEEVNPDLHWIENGRIAKRSPFPTLKLTNGKISNLPINTKVTWPDYSTSIETDGFVEMASNVSGDFSFEFEHPWYLPIKATMEYHV